MILTILLLQAAAAAPDLQLSVRARAKSVKIEQRGTSYLRLTTSPDGGNIIDVQAPPVDRNASNVTVTVDAQARIASPADPAAATVETPPPQ
jgi:predicted secreted protein